MPCHWDMIPCVESSIEEATRVHTRRSKFPPLEPCLFQSGRLDLAAVCSFNSLRLRCLMSSLVVYIVLISTRSALPSFSCRSDRMLDCCRDSHDPPRCGSQVFSCQPATSCQLEVQFPQLRPVVYCSSRNFEQGLSRFQKGDRKSLNTTKNSYMNCHER